MQGVRVVRDSARAGGRSLLPAWIVQGVAILTGLLLTVIAAFENTGGVLDATMAMLPFLALASVELTKIPLVGLAFRVPAPAWRILAMTALLIATAATFQNFVFGFERGLNEQVRGVEAAVRDVSAARDSLAQHEAQAAFLGVQQAAILQQMVVLRGEGADLQQRSRSDADELRAADTQPALRLERLRLLGAAAALQRQQEEEMTMEQRRCHEEEEPACQVAPLLRRHQIQSAAAAGRLRTVDQRLRAQEEKLQLGITDLRARRDEAQRSRDQDSLALRQSAAETDRRIEAAQQAVRRGEADLAAARQALAARLDASQLHRFCLALFGNYERLALERTKQAFVLSLAAVIAATGPLLAVLHHAAKLPARLAAPASVPVPLSPGPSAWARMLRARRGYYLRLRGDLPLVRKILVPQEVYIDRLKVVYLPLNLQEDAIAQSRRKARS